MKVPGNKLLVPLGVVVVLVAGWFMWKALNPVGFGDGFVSGNGRIEATEVDISAKLAGRVDDILVQEGDFVERGQMLASMQIQTLTAQRDEAVAQHQQAINTVLGTKAQVLVRRSDKLAAEALIAQRESELDAMKRRLKRSEMLSREGALSTQQYDDDRANVRSAEATLKAAQAQVAAAQANIEAAQAEVVGAQSAVTASLATIARIEADITDSQLVAPRAGRVQYRVAQPGEVLAAGGKVLNLVDLSDVYLTFFLPESVAGRVALGSDIRIILDAAPQYVIPAKVSFVASVAQFTPKTVETASERQKLMFRVKAQIDRDLLLRNLTQIKTGLPGVAWVKLDPQADWPVELAVKVSK